ncbi:alpha/beta hydrolase family protein [Legionella waltersii]|uniref:SdbA protein, substrate of the Dot/Icm system n=1 Tax=Legionella waltersii TaxID=66969 RepID=A0A0W1AE32_9GAMM|nr:hypothetical protein [Legionella waltersii]KTD79411.1 SdbA protein, substrate of the Dot/Icm system [Legionella waltersii]SNU97815.1 SdbA protein, substrate of the Dot/Icm system [Legionella waltersii]
MKIKHNYYSLEKDKKSFWEHLWDTITIPIKIPGWIISFLFARNITHIALNPSNAPQQRDIHLTKTSTNPEQDIVVINFKPRTPYKWFNDVLIKLTNTLTALPFITPDLRSRLQFDKTRDKKHIDWLLNEVDELLKGNSTQKHCKNKTFDWSRIHFKGLEFLDTKMRGYLFEQLHEKYGPEAYQTPRRTNIEFFTLKTADGSELDSAQVNGPDECNKPMSERKFVLTCIARDQNFISWIKDLNYTATKLGATAISFNYRGVDLSRGMVWTENNMVDDVMAQVQRLIFLGAKPENICLDGMCLGGAVATLAAAKLHKMAMRVKLNNERSFRSLPLLVFGFIVPELQTANWWSPLTYARILVAGLVYAILAPIVWLAAWGVDVEKAWDSIPTQDKIYSLVRDDQNHLYDGMVNDRVSSLAAVVDAKIRVIKEKLSKGESLTGEELEILKDSQNSPNFKPSSAALGNPNFICSHFISRQDLVAELGHRPEYTNHDYFLDRLKEKFAFGLGNRTTDETPSQALSQMGLLYQIERPLIVASSTELQSINKVKKITEEIKGKAIITHYPTRGEHIKSYSVNAIAIRIGVWLTSFHFFNGLINGFMRACGYPTFPVYKGFWDEMAILEQKEQQKWRPYVDILLDVYPSGSEFSAFYNATQKHSSSEDIHTILTYRGDTEEKYSKLVKEKIIKRLCNAAIKHVPYTQLILTQGLSVNGLCDAVIEYNNVFLPAFNKENDTDYPLVDIQLFLPEPSSFEFLPCLSSLDELSIEQKQCMEIYTGSMTDSNREAYFGPDSGFKSIHIIAPRVESAAKEQPVVNQSDTTVLTPKVQIVRKISLKRGHLLPSQSIFKNPFDRCGGMSEMDKCKYTDAQQTGASIQFS